MFCEFMCRGRLTSSEHVLPMSSIRSQWANSTQLYAGWKIREAIWTSKGASTTLILLVCQEILLDCWSWDRAMPHHCWSQKKTTLCLVEGPPAPPYSNIRAQGSSSRKDPRCLEKKNIAGRRSRWRREPASLGGAVGGFFARCKLWYFGVDSIRDINAFLGSKVLYLLPH